MSKVLQKYDVATVQYEPSQFNKDHNINSLYFYVKKQQKREQN